MQRVRVSHAILCAGMCLAFAASASAALDDQKTKPKDAATLDDSTATLTEFVDGKKKETKIDLKYCLKVKGYFDDKGLHLEEVDEDGPAFRMSNADGQAVQLEKGDIISEIAGQTIANIYDYTYALEVLKIGEPAKVVYLRNGERREAVLTPAARK